jgi:hypothetical protein
MKPLQEEPSIFHIGLIDLIRPISRPAAVLIGSPFQSSDGGIAMSTSTRFFWERAAAMSPFTRDWFDAVHALVDSDPNEFSSRFA